ncbi:MAG: sodium:proton antiporter [Planctomycetes bacterium]|nr:sodium:proton antiporter [Planctomycetota bacterium]
MVLQEPALLTNRRPDVQPFLAVPFGLLLLSIALMPFINPKIWEHHYPDFAFFLGGSVISYYVTGLNGFGPGRIEEVALQYFEFIALIGSLFIVTGGIHIDITGKSTPAINTALLAVGAVLSNLFGTTGASALLIRPYIRINKHRIRPFHVMLFIFIVSNCAGSLTPIGDPPLFLGYINGVPFMWTMVHCLPAWGFCVGMLLIVFYAMDARALKEHAGENAADDPPDEKTSVSVSGKLNFIFLGVVICGVFLDRLLEPLHLPHFPYGACLQVAAAVAAYKTSTPDNLKANEFTFNPIKEVGLLFVGIFATMVPALDYLENHAADLKVSSPTALYWASGALSSFLDNAPTYLNFFTAAHGLAGMTVGGAGTQAWLALPTVGATGFTPAKTLLAISLGSVFFGANTYIGNGPNFMVKAISEASGVKMPSFFGYILKYTIPILLPIFLIVWIVFIRG